MQAMNSIPKTSWLGLFSSLSTLICCVLPVTLVSLGMGATMASLAVKLPALVWLSENKDFVFIGAGMMIGFAALVQYLNRNQPCPIDPVLRDACTKGRRFSKIILIFSGGLYLISFTTAYLL